MVLAFALSGPIYNPPRLPGWLPARSVCSSALASKHTLVCRAKGSTGHITYSIKLQVSYSFLSVKQRVHSSVVHKIQELTPVPTFDLQTIWLARASGQFPIGARLRTFTDTTSSSLFLLFPRDFRQSNAWELCCIRFPLSGAW